MFAPALGQASPVAQNGTQYKDSSPHFDHVDALSALVGTIVGQLLQGGAPYSDTLGTFRPVVISSNGVTINNSTNHANSVIFHDTNGGPPDVFLGLSGTGALFAVPDSSSAVPVLLAAVDRALAGAFYGLAFVANGTGTQLRSYAAGVPAAIWQQTHVVKVKAGAPVDGDFATPADGMVVVDTTNNRIYARTLGVWKSVVIA